MVYPGNLATEAHRANLGYLVHRVMMASRACRDSGFFAVVGHGITPADRERLAGLVYERAAREDRVAALHVRRVADDDVEACVTQRAAPVAAADAWVPSEKDDASIPIWLEGASTARPR